MSLKGHEIVWQGMMTWQHLHLIILRSFVQEVPIRVRNQHCSIRKAPHYCGLQFTYHVLHWRLALLNQPLLADLLQQDQIWGFKIFFFFLSLMKHAEPDRLAVCSFSIHGKDEFRTIKPISCLNRWIFLLPRTGIQMKQEPTISLWPWHMFSFLGQLEKC